METHLLQRLEELAERGVNALEKLSEEPVIQIEAGPPVCPHCERINPVIRVTESEARGPFAEYLVMATCENCGRKFYGVPQTWHCFTTYDEAEEEISTRAGVLRHDNGS